MVYDFFVENVAKVATIPQQSRIALAVSGGPDSVAMLILAKKWAAEQSNKLLVLCVDHGLRPESKSEAEFVVALCNALDLESVVLTWKHSSAVSFNVQSKARKARYQLLADECKRQSICHLFTAHHKDDMVEGFILRQAKGSGIFGLLPSIRRFCNNLQIIRPLYNIPKSSLLEFLSLNNQDYCLDSSNYSLRYERVKVRNLLQTQDNYELLRDNLFATQVHIAHSAESLRHSIISFLAERAEFDQYGTCKLYCNISDVKTSYDMEVLHYILAHILTMIRGSKEVPRGSSVTHLLENILSWWQKRSSRYIFSLHGVRIECKKNALSFAREFYRATPEELVINSRTNNTRWDERFVITVPNTLASQGVVVTCLSESDITVAKSNLQPEELNYILNYIESSDLTRRILLTLPVVKTLEKLVAIPHINYYDNSEAKLIRAKFKPQFTSNIVHFNAIAGY